MSDDEKVQDVICLAIPPEIDPELYLGHQDPQVALIFYTRLTEIAREQVWRQWPVRRPVDVSWEAIEWMLTQKIEDIDLFQPAHDCEQCHLGSVRAEAFLREFPGRWIAMGNLTYTPRWAE